jgi:two-component system response regulator YesN
LQEIEPLVTQFLSDICNRIRKQQASHNHSLIFKARRFIEKSYTNEDLGLNEVAEHVAVSSCYLSILFKRETDETFTEYLTRVRMEKAKELLRTTDLKAYQIAAQIGYTDPHYFSQCFKKYTGLNPTQYKTGSGDTI